MKLKLLLHYLMEKKLREEKAVLCLTTVRIIDKLHCTQRNSKQVHIGSRRIGAKLVKQGYKVTGL